MKGYQIQEAFCSKLRLQIISNLVSKKLLFTELKKLTNASDGNLSVQLKKLEGWEYIKSEKNMSIREMKVDDLKRIVELEKDLFLSPWNEEDFIHELKENPMAGYYILEKENQIIGYIGLWFLGDQCQITTIATDRHFQGQG